MRRVPMHAAWRWGALALAAVVLVAGCTAGSTFQPRLDAIQRALDEAKAQGALRLAPESYAWAEACLELAKHEAFEVFGKWADSNTEGILAHCERRDERDGENQAWPVSSLNQHRTTPSWRKIRRAGK